MKIKIKHENANITFKASKNIVVKDLLKSLKANNSLNLKNQELILLDESQRILQPEDVINVVADKAEKNPTDLSIPLTNNSISIINEKTLYLQTFKKQMQSKEKYTSVEDFFSNKTLRDNLNNARNNQNKLNEISDLIMKTTNAKEKINTSSIPRLIQSTSDQLSALEELLGPNLTGIINPSLQAGGLGSRATQISQLLNILRPMIDNVGESDHFTISNSIGSNANRPSGTHRLFYNPQPVVADQNLLNNLKEMGFPEEQCRRALIVARNDISRATDLLLNDALDYIPNQM